MLGTHVEMEKSVRQTLLLIRQAGKPQGRQGDTPPPAPVRDWIDPRYEALVAAWDAMHPPPEAIGFLYSHA